MNRKVGPQRGPRFLARLLLVCMSSLSLVQNAFADIVNSAVAEGTFLSAPVLSDPSLVSIPVTLAAPAVALLKSSTFNDESGDGAAQLNETISYSFTVTNTGNTTLTNITLNDPIAGVTGGPIASLLPAASDSTTFSGTHTITLADLAAGQVVNSATVTADRPGGGTVNDVSDSQNPGDDTGADNDPTTTPLPFAVIDAVDNDFSASPINSFTGGNTPTVLSNDTLNGSPFVPAVVTTTVVNNGGLTGVSVNPDGTLNVPIGTPPATYTVRYRICEVANPANCDEADATGIVVTAATISAVDDSFISTPINGFTGGATTTVYVNDTLNGNPFTPVTVTPAITADGGLTGVAINAADGTLTVPAGAPAGTYIVTYRICEAAQPTNCDTANATILINPPAIDAVADDFTASPVNGLAGGTTPTVFTNDTLNGAAFAPAAVTPAITADGGLTGVTIASNGTLTVPPGTPSGTYGVTYQICEVLNPSNCDTAIATVVVNAATIVADDDDFTSAPINGFTGGATATIFSNDTLNGAAFAASAVTATITADGGLTGVTITPAGILNVPAGTPAGSYGVTYRICEALNATNCDTAIVTVVINPPAIVANDDDFSAAPINGASGGATATVFTNDTLSGSPFANSAVTPTITADGGLTGVTINPDGTLAVPAGTPANTYAVTYQICEVLNPANCDTAIATVIIDPPAIVANDDDFTPSPVNGLSGGNTPTVYANDTLNGVAFAPAAVTPTVTADGGLTGVTMNPDGTLTVPAGTPAAAYNVTYQICEVLNPTNCDTAIASIVVSAATIDAVDNDFSASPFNSGTGGTTPTVFTNDTLNGSAFANSAVIPAITGNGGLTGLAINPDGTITVPAGAAPGSYTVSYRICEVANATNCDTANVIIAISPQLIDAVDNDFTSTPVNGLTGGATPSVYGNDTLNGAAFANSAVTPSITADGGLTGVIINADGTLTVPPGTSAGTYTVGYRICETANAANCDTANATVAVNPPVINAVNDDFTPTPVNGLTGGDTPTVFTNDTLNGVAFGPSAVAPTITSAGGLTGVTINPSGTLAVPPSTPAGTYTVGYRICEALNPTNCDTANATVVVNPPAIVANDDDFTSSPVNGLTGGSTPTVYTNDTLNGVPFAPAAVTPTIVSNGGLTGVTISPAGAITVPAGTPAATYTVNYRICEIANPTNCDTANVTVVVGAPTINAADDNFTATPISSAAGGATATVFTNDTLNGNPFAPAAVTPAITANGGLTGAAINPDGTITVPAGTAPGVYTVTYRICETANATNCDTANATVQVNASVINAVNDIFSGTPINGGAGGNTPTVFTNDTLNGSPFVSSSVTPTIFANGGLTGVTINPDGTLTVPAGTPNGTYTVTYQICEVATPSNCDTATATVVVAPAVILANDDDFSSAPIPTTGGVTASVFGNDTLNGGGFAAAAVVPSIVSAGGLTGVTINPDGTLSVPAGTVPGTYVVNYQICQAAAPANCDAANATILVPAPSTTASVGGTVFFDRNGDGQFNGGDAPAGSGYIVQLVNASGTVVGSTVTGTNGTYAITAPAAAGYSLVFSSPSGAALGAINNLTLNPGQTIIDQNQPIDPSGIIYNSVTHLPVAGVTVTLADLNNQPLPAACLISPSQQNQVTAADGAYRFDLVPGAAAQCPAGQTEYHILVANPSGYQPGVSTANPPQTGALDATACATSPASCQVSPSASPPPVGTDGTYYVSILLEANDPHVVNNHIPIDPVAVPTDAAFTKKALVSTVHRGERVPYVIEATQVSINPARIVDIVPKGFDYVPGSATVNDVAIEPAVSGNSLTFDNLAPDASQKITLKLLLTATVAVTNGPKVNKAQLVDPSNGAILATSQATVTVVVDHVFDCGDIIGKVFDDKNRNGYQDKGEPGLPDVRLVTVKGVQILTDKNGQFHVACADVPDASIGSNFILKLDTRTLPSGYRVTSENPRIVRLTQGKVTKLNFGASITRVVRFDVTGEAFVDGTAKLKPEWIPAVDKLITILDGERSTLRLSYYAKSNNSELAAQRLAGIAKLVATKWKSESGRYDLPIERRLIGPKAQLSK